MTEFIVGYLCVGAVLSAILAIHAAIRKRLRSDLLLSLMIAGVFLWPVVLVGGYYAFKREMMREKDES